MLQSQYPVRVPGFKTFARGWQEGFRGHAVLVCSHLASYEVPHAEKLEGYKYLLHVKVPSIPIPHGPKHALHFVGVYLPSGGNMRSRRTAGLIALKDLHDRIKRNEDGALIVAMGDFNCTPLQLQWGVKRVDDTLQYVAPRGSLLTCFPVRGAPSSLDHLLTSVAAQPLLVRPRVSRHWNLSDHRPLVCALRVHNLVSHPTPGSPELKGTHLSRVNLARYSFEMVNDNRWLALEEREVPDATSLSWLSSDFSGTLGNVLQTHGIRVESRPSTKPYFPNRLKVSLKAYRDISAIAARHLNTKDKVGQQIITRYVAACSKFRNELDKWQRREESKNYTRIAEDLVAHDYRNVWSWLKSQVETNE